MPVLLPAAEHTSFWLAAAFPAPIPRQRISTSPFPGKRSASYMSKVNTIGCSALNANDGPRMYPHAPAYMLPFVPTEAVHLSSVSARLHSARQQHSPCFLQASKQCVWSSAVVATRVFAFTFAEQHGRSHRHAFCTWVATKA